MNSKNRKTLIEIFKHPIPSNIDWKDIENLFRALGAVNSVRRFLENAGFTEANI